MLLLPCVIVILQLWICRTSGSRIMSEPLVSAMCWPPKDGVDLKHIERDFVGFKLVWSRHTGIDGPVSSWLASAYLNHPWHGSRIEFIGLGLSILRGSWLMWLDLHHGRKEQGLDESCHFIC